MANELNFSYTAGQSIEAGIYAQGWTQQGANIPMVESSPGLYVASVPGLPAIADGEYGVLFEDAGAGNARVGRGTLFWTSNAEDFRTLDNRMDGDHGAGSWLTADVQAAMDAQGYTSARAALLDFLDALISSRAAPGDDMGLTVGALTNIQSQILSDATPFAGANINATISSRSVPGDDMNLTTLALSSVQSQILTDATPFPGASIDVTISSRAAPGDDMNLTTVALTAVQSEILNDATPFAGADVGSILTSLTGLIEFVRGGRDIDFTGNDVLGWQRIERDEVGVEVARYNLFDEDGNRIDSTVQQFLAAGKMISAEVLL